MQPQGAAERPDLMADSLGGRPARSRRCHIKTGHDVSVLFFLFFSSPPSLLPLALIMPPRLLSSCLFLVCRHSQPTGHSQQAGDDATLDGTFSVLGFVLWSITVGEYEGATQLASTSSST